jgi:hypothetical protein
MTTASDSFTNTDNVALATHNANWTVNAGAFVIKSNGIVANTSLAGSLARYAGTWAADQWSEVTLQDPTGGGTIGAAVRASTSGAYTGYTADAGKVGADDKLYVSKYVGGTYTDLRTQNLTYSTNDRLRIQVSGSSPATIKIYLNDSQVGTDITDSSSPIASGSPGISGYDNAQNNIGLAWSAEDTGGGATAAIAAYYNMLRNS